MAITARPRLRSRLQPRRSGTGLALLTAAMTASALTVAPAQVSAAPVADCPTAHPVDELTADQPVTGLTVTSGTTPTGFTGSVLGVIESGIAPELDMIVARLSSPEIDRVGGIWQGMSGSPVYAADGRLIGAVAYGLAWGPSTVAGITPYAEMQRLLAAPASDASARRALEEVAEAEEVEIPPVLARSMATSGVLPRAQSEGGLERLPLPLGVSGMGVGSRLSRFADALDLPGVRVHAAGAVDAASEPVPVEAGSNLAASLSYGDVSAVGVGTATAVCGDQVLAFGHPMAFTGPSQLAMHGARAVYVQEDPVSAPFKVANPSAPIGAVLQDRMAGLLTVQDAAAIPTTTDVTSYVEVPGEWSREGTTHINLPTAVPDIAAFHLLADQDRVFDGISGGSATVGWTVRGSRVDGSPFAFTRTDVFANKSDVSFEPVFDLYDQLAQLQFNEVEEISIDSVDTTSTMSRQHVAYSISRVQIFERRRWRDLVTNQPLFVRAGQTKRFRVTLTSPTLGRRIVRTEIVMPLRTGRKFGFIEIVGGNSVMPDFGGEEFSEFGYLDGSLGSEKSFDGVLRRIRRAPTNDMVMANLSLFRMNGSAIRRTDRTKTGTVVNGMVMVEVQGIG